MNDAARIASRIGLAAMIPLLCACAPNGLADLSGQLSRVAREQVLSTLAGQYSQRLGGGLDSVIGELGRPGGYLDNPLVRILLPPPLGLVLGAARDLRADPQAALLETLMNQAAEQAVPGAAPIVRTALRQLTPAEARRLLAGDVTAGSDYLKARTGDALQAALQPVIADKLSETGATAIYGALAHAYRTQHSAAQRDAGTPPPPAVPELADYVTERAVDGLFNTLGAHEAHIREELDRATGGMLVP